MTKQNDGGPAFPTLWTNDSDVNVTAPDGQVLAPGHAVNLHGLSVRDYFAAKAMQSLIVGESQREWDDANTASAAYRIADAMLKARSK